ncbi:chromosome segregation protein SMC (plasmid) [Paroceanicella profunda]|uniref:Chromosome segregation protein SMC n=1 Tax=Paroceanicella profunda TaxID=2579971 RepID=A0A5B8FJ31_9RHOB|nr:ATP-binding protein [Paroceanicella profunda]QDL93977.1 chromosome segregation protein SMC [Paroceanicella profunda]
MKLRALRLSNVRKFAGRTASLTGIGDGITVLSEANEFGKSTFFDALHALFFERYAANGKSVQMLQPRAGGSVEVSADVETPEGLFRVEKRWLASRRARVLRLSGAGAQEEVIALDDEAERWLAALIGSGREGPAGLLWVRQGQLGLEPDSRAERDRLTETRRDLLSSVAGEIDAMTGGRRMDRVMRRCEEALEALITRPGRPRGPWKDALDDAAELARTLEEVEAQCTALAGFLAERAEAERQLQRLDDPDAKARREEALRQAQAAMDLGERHDTQLREARQAAEIARLEAGGARAELDRLIATRTRLRAAQAALAEAEATATAATAAAAACDEAQDAARARLDTARSALDTARGRLDAASRRLRARKAREDLTRLTRLLDQADTQQRRRDSARARAKTAVATPAWLDRVAAADAAVGEARAALRARSASARIRYSGPARALLEGAELPGDTDVPLAATAVFDLPGLGTLTLRSGEQSAAGALSHTLSEAEATLAALLAEAGAGTPAEARAAGQRLAEDLNEARLAEAMLKALAPEGLDQLRAARTEAEERAEGTGEETQGDTPLAELEAALDTARGAELAAREALDTAAAARARAREQAAADSAARESAQRDFDRAAEAAGAEAEHDARQAGAARSLALAEAAEARARERCAALTRAAPDLETLRADLTRAGQAIESVATRRARLSETLLRATERIRAMADGAIEERRDELRGRLEEAQARAARLEGEVRALQRLRAALESTRSAARDAYFGPVRDELKPLLNILHAEADLAFDSDSLLPAALSRGATEEAFDTLSGGTQEQIAILTRLAFARLFARQGRPLPIVLDDALVYSDDSRIVKMFTALTRVAQGQQILVFSCRQLAFQDLGGARPVIEVEEMA